MDKAIRNELRKTVINCRKSLEISIGDELEGQYGIYRDGKVDDSTFITHLSEEDHVFREQLIVHLMHIESEGFKLQDAVEQLIREVAYTHLNRLCAYKMMEVRGLIKETISRGLNSNGFKFYLAEHDEDERLWKTGEQYQAYKHYLEWLGSTLSEEIGVLFSPHDPANSLFPKQPVLEEIMGYINKGELAEIWDNDETIGWIYQYFTPKELRENARKESQAPRNSYELAFRNQFFTPRYVVEFLADNTLGRIWYEMRKGETTLKEKCQYLVIRPNEIFLGSEEEPPQDANEDDKELSQEELLKKPAYILHREKKDPREIKILDPACGSGHFLLYCFDLLETIYEEAYDDPDLGPKLKEDYHTLYELKCAVPGLILGRNLFGVDIDLRATQIAALALWLRTQKSHGVHGIRSKDRPKITRSNIVVAEPMPGNQKMLSDFIIGLKPPIIGQLVETVFEKMKLAGEAGTLLKIEEEIKGVISEAKQQWLTKPKNVQIDLFGEKISGTSQISLDFRGITDEDFWGQAETRVIESLHDYAEMATSQEKLSRQLFADDAAQGFAFIDICRNRYDVVVMNPPFGEASENTRVLFQKEYPEWNKNILCAFIDRSLNIIKNDGALGVIFDRTAIIKTTYQKFRKTILIQNSMFSLADTGWEVLDANVETTTMVFLKNNLRRKKDLTTFFNIRDILSFEKQIKLSEMIRKFRSGNLGKDVFITNQNSFEKLPNSVIGYDFPQFSINHFNLFEQITKKYGIAVKGHDIKSNQYQRYFWEIPFFEIQNGSYSLFFNGGPYSKFFLPSIQVIPLESKKEEIKNHAQCLFRNIQYQKRRGIGYGKRGEFVDLQILRPNHFFSAEGLALFHKKSLEDLWFLLGILNSSLIQMTINLYCGQHKGASYINLLPISDSVSNQSYHNISLLTKKYYYHKSTWYLSDETNYQFEKPWIVKWLERDENYKDINEIINALITYEQKVDKELEQISTDIDNRTLELYGVTNPNDVALVENAVERRPKDVLWKETRGYSEEQKKFYHVESLISFWVGCLFGRLDVINGSFFDKQFLQSNEIFDLRDTISKKAVELWEKDEIIAEPTKFALSDEEIEACSRVDYPNIINPDGIIPLDEGHPQDLIKLVEQVAEIYFGERNHEEVIKEVENLLGQNLRNHFSKKFFNSHLDRYLKKPIYWLLQSSNKNYALWIYYHRLDKDLYYKALVNYVEPKVRLEEDQLKQLRNQLAEMGSGGHDVKKQEKLIEKQEDFVTELHDFRDKLKRVAELNLEQDLDDGVVLNIAPLHELVPWTEAKKYWDDLKAGKYEWSTISKQMKEKGLI